MSAFDIIVLFLVAALGLKGLLRGFIKETCGLIALIGGIYMASRYAPQASFVFTEFGLAPTSASVGGFLLVFVGVWLVVTYSAALLAKGANISGLGGLDKILGFGAGALKVYVILSVIIFALLNVAFLRPKISHYTTDSFLVVNMMQVGSLVMNLKPSDISAEPLINAVTDQNGTSL